MTARKVIAIDFDGCLCRDEWPGIGAPNWFVVEKAKAEQKAGAKLILWTCREGEMLDAAVSACQSWGLVFDAVNDSLAEWKVRYGSNPRKVGASEYWDDKAVRMDESYVFDGAGQKMTRQRMTRQKMTRSQNGGKAHENH